MVSGDRFTLYVQNQSVNDVTVTEILLAGAPYTYVVDTPLCGAIPTALAAYTGAAPADPLDGEYLIIERGDILLATGSTLKCAPQATLEPGEDVTLLFAIDDDVPIGRDVQLKLTTANGAVFVTTLIAGQSSG